MTEPTGSTTPEAAADASPAEKLDTSVWVAAVDEATVKAAELTAPAAKKSLEDSLVSVDEDTRKFILSEVSKARRSEQAARGDRTRAVNEAKSEFAQTIGKALGLVAEEADPAKLTEQLTAQTAAADDARRELAVYRAASGKADAAKLLDSRSFLEKVKGVDLSDPVALDAAIAEAVATNPAYGLAESRRIPAPNSAQGANAFGGSPTLDDQFAAAVKSGDTREQIRIQNLKLSAALAKR